jgi:hypothetical protein
MQRISTLYGVFHYGEPKISDMFNVYFDLMHERFVFPRELEYDSVYIQLAHLFSPREFLGDQQKLIERANGELLIDRAIKVHTIFQEYMLPLVTIEGRTVTEVVQIFERINSTGTSLSAVDFMRAVTWSEEFDLNQEVSKVVEVLSGTGFQFDDETVVKVLAVVLDRDPTPESMLTLRQCSHRELQDAIIRTGEILNGVVQMLQRELNIASADYIPYQGQILVLAKMLATGLIAEAADLGKRWFLAIELNEGLRGKPDNYLVRVMSAAAPTDLGRRPYLDIHLALDPSALMKRRFIRMRALSAGIATLFSLHGARSIISGEIVDPTAYMTEFTSKAFVPIFDLLALKNVMGDLPSPRLIPNMLLVSESDALVMQNSRPVNYIETIYERLGDTAGQVLESQFISEEMIDLLKQGLVDDFLFKRSHAILAAGLSVLAGREG